MVYNMTSLSHSKKFKEKLEPKLETLINLLNNRTSKNYEVECYVYFSTVNIIIYNIKESSFKKFSVNANKILKDDMNELSIMLLKSYNKR